MGPKHSKRATGARRGILRFLAVFGAVLIAGHFLAGEPFLQRAAVLPWTDGNVRLSAALASAVGIEGARGDARRLEAGDTVLQVNKGCDGTGAVLILISAIAAFPASFRARLLGIAAGTLALFLLNAVRLCSLLLIAVRWPARLDFFHVDVWQPAMMLVSFALFALWSSLSTHGRETLPSDELGN